MKTAKYLLILLLLCGNVVLYAQKHLTILHTNDTHSCIMPLSTHLADTLQAGRGGFLRLRQWRLLSRLTLLHLVQGRCRDRADEYDAL